MLSPLSSNLKFRRGVYRNYTFAVHPDPISGMHCWHQKVSIEKAHPEDKYGDVFVDTEKSMQIYKQWLELTRPAPGPNNLGLSGILCNLIF